MISGDGPAGEAKVTVLILAAGASSRMDGPDKLMAERDGVPMLQYPLTAALASQADQVLAITPATHPLRRDLARRMGVAVVEIADASGGMSASVRAGLAAVADDVDAVIIALGDMPDVTDEHFARLIEAFSPADGHEICRAVTDDGRPGHPVMFGRRFFAALSALQGDAGAREVVRAMPEFVVEVPMPGSGAVRDIDTPAELEAWLRGG